MATYYGDITNGKLWIKLDLYKNICECIIRYNFETVKYIKIKINVDDNFNISGKQKNIKLYTEYMDNIIINGKLEINGVIYPVILNKKYFNFENIKKELITTCNIM